MTKRYSADGIEFSSTAKRDITHAVLVTWTSGYWFERNIAENHSQTEIFSKHSSRELAQKELDKADTLGTYRLVEVTKI